MNNLSASFPMKKESISTNEISSNTNNSPKTLAIKRKWEQIFDSSNNVSRIENQVQKSPRFISSQVRSFLNAIQDGNTQTLQTYLDELSHIQNSYSKYIQVLKYAIHYEEKNCIDCILNSFEALQGSLFIGDLALEALKIAQKTQSKNILKYLLDRTIEAKNEKLLFDFFSYIESSDDKLELYIHNIVCSLSEENSYESALLQCVSTPSYNYGEQDCAAIAKICMENLSDTILERGFSNDEKPFLWLAVRSGCVKIAQLFLERGVSATIKNLSRDTLLFKAVKKGDLKMVQLLIKYGADCTEKDILGRTILMLACKNGNLEVAQYLLSLNKIDLNAQDEDGETALLKAFFYDGDENRVQQMIYLLLEHNASPLIADYSGYTALHAACWLGNLELALRFINAGCNINMQDTKGKTPLHSAIESDIYPKPEYKYVIDYFLIQGFQTKLKDKKGNSVLDLAMYYLTYAQDENCWNSGCEVVKMLLKKEPLPLNFESKIAESIKMALEISSVSWIQFAFKKLGYGNIQLPLTHSLCNLLPEEVEELIRKIESGTISVNNLDLTLGFTLCLLKESEEIAQRLFNLGAKPYNLISFPTQKSYFSASIAELWLRSWIILLQDYAKKPSDSNLSKDSLIMLFKNLNSFFIRKEAFSSLGSAWNKYKSIIQNDLKIAFINGDWRMSYDTYLHNLNLRPALRLI